jgi:hypothetical protein
MLGAPLVWAILLMFHPDPTQDIHAGLHDEVTPWLVVHLGTLVGICLIGVVLQLLVRGLPGRAAAISRWAVLPYVLFYGAAEAIQGIATGVVVRYANQVSEAERATAAGAVQALWDDVIAEHVISGLGLVAWVVTVVAAGVAHRQAGAPWGVTLLLCASAVALIHTPPFGPFGLGCITAAIAWLGWRRRALPADPARSPLPISREG